MTRYPDRRTFLAAAAAGTLLPLAARAQAPAPAGGLTLAQIRQSGELRIGVEAAYLPFTFRREGQIVGYDVDLAESSVARWACVRRSSTPPGQA